MKREMKLEITAGLFLLLSIFLSVGHYRAVGEGSRLTKVNQELSTSLSVAETKNTNLERVYSLSVEFGFDPLIVELVNHEAAEVMKEVGEEWRLIQTPQYLTYLMLSLIAVESNGNTWAIGDKGKARGLTQIWTPTAKLYQEDITAAALLNPQVNIEISFKHFHALLKKYYGNFTLVLYAWNRGSGKVDRLIAYGRAVENGYGHKVYNASLNRNKEIFYVND